MREGRQRGVLIVNPHATTTSPRVTDVLVNALAGEVDLQIVRTEHRGHAAEIAGRARAEVADLLCVLGGDGTVNEAANGLLADGPAPHGPRLAIIPGGSANVAARALGLPADPVEATGEILQALREGRSRQIGLGIAVITTWDGETRAPRWFLANAGLGIDAEIIAAMEADRSDGHEATPTRYLMTTIRQFLWRTNRRDPALEIDLPDTEVAGVFLAIVQNTSPWTYLGALPISPCPDASFDAGLDLFAVRRMSLGSAMRLARRMVAGSRAGSTARSLTVAHDLPALAVRATRPTALQVDGEGLGEVSRVEFASAPAALTVIA
jgi:diacylglycerol kinase family enzyme